MAHDKADLPEGSVFLAVDYGRVGEYAVPTDPMDELQCESCQ